MINIMEIEKKPAIQSSNLYEQDLPSILFI